MNIFNYFKSLFKKSTKEETTINIAEEDNEETHQFCTSHDVFGNDVQDGVLVIPIKYNELKRRGYITIPSKYEVMAFNDSFKNNNYIKLSEIDNLNVSTSKRHGYLHVSNM